MAQHQGDRLLQELISFSEGGVSYAYRGIYQGRPVIVKKPGKFGATDWRKDYMYNEFIVLSQISHKNIVKLLGCCYETEVVALVYEFCPNQSLHYHIHTVDPRHRLSWKHRLRIATEIADALSYLHTATSTPIIHRDVKPWNIFMDERLTAKIANFGLSISIPPGETQVDSDVIGPTKIYSSPEYFTSFQMTEKVDVYSYGVLLLELLKGKPPGVPITHKGRETALVEHFSSILRADSDNLTQVFDVFILEEGNVEQLVACAHLCFKCIRLRAEDRPTMKEVAKELRKMGRCSSYPNF
ncbi:hypothetical protein H6P81_001097 [Aristolochia fimbriata]|uniref:Protein kinase domain-containing protein n=1 Tax=Aristolochia fimbriata TaxID=158543 RepID=A0AAV7F7E8_ARIFI|nr:hypothetical protein H6P81_001097 [Aristolochia fimbriata]